MTVEDVPVFPQILYLQYIGQPISCYITITIPTVQLDDPLVEV